MWEWEDATDPPPEPEPTPAPDAGPELSVEMKLQLEKHKEMLKLEQQRLAIQGKMLEMSKARTKYERNRVDAMESIAEAMTKEGADMVQLTKDMQALSKEIQTSSEASKWFKSRMADIAKMTDDPQKMAKAYAHLKAQLEDVNKFADSVSSSLTSMGKAFGYSFDVANTKSGPVLKMLGGLASDSGTIGEKFKKIGAGLAQMFGPITILANLIDFLIKMFTEIEDAAVAAGNAGMQSMDAYREVIAETAGELTKLGLDMKAVAASAGKMNFEVYKGYQLSTKQAHKLAKQQHILAKFGVAETKQRQILNKLVIRTGKPIAQLQKKMIALSHVGKEIGIAPAEMLEGMETAMSNIGGPIDEVTEQLVKMTVKAKASGMAVNELMNIGKKFDTFKSAADTVAKLNSVLGTSFSSLQLQMMPVGERAQFLGEAIGRHVGDFDQLDRATQLLIAGELAQGDMNKAKGLMGQLSAEETAKQNEAIDSAKKYNEAMGDMRKLLVNNAGSFEKIMRGIKSFALNSETMIGAMKTMQAAAADISTTLENLEFWWTQNGEAIKSVGKTLFMAWAAWKTFNIVMIVSKGIYQGILLMQNLWALRETANTGIKWLATAASMALGVANLFAMAAIVALIVGLVMLYNWLHKSGSPPLYLLAGVMAIGVIALGVAMYAAGPAIVPVVLALAAYLPLSRLYFMRYLH